MYWFIPVQNRCQPWVLKSANSIKTCTAKASGNGYNCSFTCQSGYYFSNDVNSQTISTSCFTNDDWTTTPSDCVARNPAYYRQSFVLRYGTGTLSDPTTCTNLYQTQLQNQWNTMASNLATMCRNNQPGFSITVSPPVDSTVSRLGVEYSNVSSINKLDSNDGVWSQSTRWMSKLLFTYYTCTQLVGDILESPCLNCITIISTQMDGLNSNLDCCFI